MNNIKFKRKYRFALASIILELISLAIAIVLIVLNLIIYTKWHNGSWFFEDYEKLEKLWVIAVIQLFFVYIVCCIVNIINNTKLEGKSVMVLCILGAFIPVLGLIGAFVLYFKLKKVTKLNNVVDQNNVEMNQSILFVQNNSNDSDKNYELKTENEYSKKYNENINDVSIQRYFNSNNEKTIDSGNKNEIEDKNSIKYKLINNVVISILVLQLILLVINIFSWYTINNYDLNSKKLEYFFNVLPYLNFIITIPIFVMTIYFLVISKKIDHLKKEWISIIIFFSIFQTYNIFFGMVKFLLKWISKLVQKNWIEFIVERYSMSTIFIIFTIVISIFLISAIVKNNILFKEASEKNNANLK